MSPALRGSLAIHLALTRSGNWCPHTAPAIAVATLSAASTVVVTYVERLASTLPASRQPYRALHANVEPYQPRGQAESQATNESRSEELEG
jgi:hypothetical protein